MRLVPKSNPSVTIIGTQECVYGTCRIIPEADADGGWTFEYEGSGTDIDWNSQETVTDERGNRHFIGDDWNVYLENELELIDDDET